MTFCADSSIPYLDLVVLAFVIICGLVGLKKGFWMSLISLFSGIVILIIVYFIAQPVANWLGQMEFIDSLLYNETGSLQSLIAKALPMETLNLAQVGTDAVSGAVLATNLKLLGTFVIGLVDPTKFEATTLFGNALATVLTEKAFTIIVGIILYVLIKIVVGIIKSIIRNARERGVVSGLVRFLGFLLGLAKGAAFIIFLMVLMFLFQEKSFMEPINAQLDKSVVIKPITTMVFESAEKTMEKDTWLGNTLKSLRAFSLGKDAETEDETEENEPTATEFLTAYETLLADTESLNEVQKLEIVSAYNKLSDAEKDKIDADLTLKITSLEAVPLENGEG